MAWGTGVEISVVIGAGVWTGSITGDYVIGSCINGAAAIPAPNPRSVFNSVLKTAWGGS